MEHNYEDSFKRLERIISELQNKNLSLEQSIDKYEEGIELYRHCREILNKYQGRVENIKKENSDIF